MYSAEARNKYAELLKTATEALAPLFGVDVEQEDLSEEKGEDK